MKNISYYLLIAWLLNSCSGVQNENDLTHPPDAIDSIRIVDTIRFKNGIVNIEIITGEEFEKQPSKGSNPSKLEEEKSLLSKDASFISLKGSDYIINLKNDSSIQLIESSSEEDIVSYTYIGKLHGTELLVFFCSYFEFYDYLIVNRENGQQVHIWGSPVLSPEKKHLLASNYDLAAAFTPNGIQLYSVNNEGLTLKFQKEFTTWGPDSPKWIDDNTIYLIQKSSDENGGDIKNYAKIVSK